MCTNSFKYSILSLCMLQVTHVFFSTVEKLRLLKFHFLSLLYVKEEILAELNLFVTGSVSPVI